MKEFEVIVLLPFVQGKKSFGYGDEILLNQEVAYKFAKKGIVEFKIKKQFLKLESEIKEKAKVKQEEKEEDERRAAAILNRHNLEKERTKLQNRVDAITHILDDGEVYYKVYGDLADDLAKSKGIESKENTTPNLLEGLINENTNDGKKTDLSQGEGN